MNNLPQNSILAITTIEVDGKTQNVISARDLHSKLQIVTPLHKWIERKIQEYEFEAKKEFWTNLSKNKNGGGKGRNRKEYFSRVSGTCGF